MADRRMLSKTFAESDGFASLTAGARLLYFYINLHADDDGFSGQVKRIARSEGIDPSAIDELVKGGFLIQFDSGVYLLSHWNVNNCIQSDRYHQTVYLTEKAAVTLNANKIWEKLDTSRIHSVSNSDTSRIHSVSNLDTQLDKDRLVQSDKPSVAQSNVAQSSVAQSSTEESGETELSKHDRQKKPSSQDTIHSPTERFKAYCERKAATPSPSGDRGTP